MIDPIKSIELNKEALEAYHAGDFKKACQLFILKADQGDTYAQYSLGLMYGEGRGIPQDDKEAVKWFRLAAEQGHRSAQWKLELISAKGRGVQQDDKEAVKSYRLAAEQGDACSQYNLGCMYIDGKGVPKDEKEAVKWFRLAAEQGDGSAQWALGTMYTSGRGVPQDGKEAVKWFRLAAEQGDGSAQWDLGVMYTTGRGVPQDGKEAVKWFRLAAEQGQIDAQWNLGLIYVDRDSVHVWEPRPGTHNMTNCRGQVQQDDKEAVKWFRLAAEQGDVNSQYNLGCMYKDGKGVPRDNKEAAKWFRLAAEQGQVSAQFNLGCIYEDGKGVTQDKKEAAKWFRLAAEQGDGSAQRALELRFKEPRSVPQDGKKGSSDPIPSAVDKQSYLENTDNEHVSLLESISDIIKDYRYGEIDKPTSDHVARWISQFDKQIQTQILYEANHVLKRTYFSKERITQYFTNQLECLELLGKKPHEFWLGSHILNIQKNGQSQKEICDLFGKALKSKFGFELNDCGSDGGAYFYLDDALFTGSRIEQDLSTWIKEEAPKRGTVYILTVASHLLGEWHLRNRLAEISLSTGKQLDFQFWAAVRYENRMAYRNKSEVLWPVEIPDDPLLQAYLAEELKFPFQVRYSGGELENAIFSTENGRQLLEKEFLLAGMRIRSFSQSPNIMLRPLGFSSFGLGFGSMIVTYRNCPNNTPLALWWGDINAPSHNPLSKWYPLLPRKTYEDKQSKRESIFR
ncbi:MAG: SEL1-like repeat protein [Chlorobium sp.]|nr:SEL1-like repeat protein [Chlorobium sp.]